MENLELELETQSTQESPYSSKLHMYRNNSAAVGSIRM